MDDILISDLDVGHSEKKSLTKKILLFWGLQIVPEKKIWRGDFVNYLGYKICL